MFCRVSQGERLGQNTALINAEGARPIKQTPYHIPYAYREMVKKELVEVEEKGIIEPSTSDWAFPLVLVGKKDGTM